MEISPQQPTHAASKLTLPSAPRIAIELTDLAQERLRSVRLAGVDIDDAGLVVPRVNRETVSRIADNLLDIRQRVTQEIQQGRHVLYVPGSYDLLHAGHASWILEGISAYQTAHSGLTRDDIFVVALCDDDELVRGVKPAHVVNTPGEHPRPIECAELFQHLTPRHPRLLDLATLPIDLVGFIPAPSMFGDVLNSPVFRSWLRRSPVAVGLGADESPEGHRLNQLRDRLLEGKFGDVVAAFQRAKFNLDYEASSAAWDVSSWQTLLHAFIGDVYLEHSSERFVRLISEHDVKYKDRVALAMAQCGIGHQFVDDVEIVSTTALIRQFGWENLARRKLGYFETLREQSVFL